MKKPAPLSSKLRTWLVQMQQQSKQVKLLMLLALLFPVLAACQSTKSPTPITETTDSSVCLVWKAISYSGKNDTPETVAEIVKNNAARKEYCP